MSIVGVGQKRKGSIINVGVAKPKGRATPNIYYKTRTHRVTAL